MFFFFFFSLACILTTQHASPVGSGIIIFKNEDFIDVLEFITVLKCLCLLVVVWKLSVNIPRKALAK